MFKDWLKGWLLKKEILWLARREQELQNLLQSYRDSEVKRLTLEDLQLTLEERVLMKSCDKTFRHALWKSGEHLCLTSIPECCRKTAVAYREYQRRLTLSEKNRIPELDDTPMEKADERSRKFFAPKQ